MAAEHVKKGWDKIKREIAAIKELYTYEEVRSLLLKDEYYKTLYGKAKNRTLLSQDKKLYKSIYEYTSKLEYIFVEQQSYKTSYNFASRIRFIVDYNLELERLKCDCGKSYNWTKYCRRCPEYHRTQRGKPHTECTKRKMRVGAIRYIAEARGQVIPRYNRSSIAVIEDYGKLWGYNFKHAENGGEYYIKELGYFIDAYDPDKNVVLEFDEKRHFDSDGNLKEKDIQRQAQIEKLLKCKFIRIKYDTI